MPHATDQREPNFAVASRCCAEIKCLWAKADLFRQLPVTHLGRWILGDDDSKKAGTRPKRPTSPSQFLHP
ncbi:hypothetical protein CEXT_344791 [Caerostris extrusa]|uniref:Uncharacterized protein n=1 Tax=Caerostris extrusa TaxID=172846 RepID=A0AAV4P5R2_CAEEX|nr:hypothetical protein CEXT_344791 [Caerostris extrusa]